MNKCAIFGAMILLMVFNIGCKDDPEDDGREINIENEFKILPWEALGANTRNFYLNIETIQSQSCENSLIELTSTAVGSTITLTIRDIPEPDCPAPIFPAIANFEVGNLILTDYSLQISLKDLVHNLGNMTVTDEYYDIQMADLDGLVIPNTRLYKVPKETIWGYASYSNADEADFVVEFVDEVKNVSTDQDYKDGYYGYFSVENNSLNIINEVLPKQFSQTFGYSFQSDISELEAILTNYRTLHPNIDFKIFTSKGEIL